MSFWIFIPLITSVIMITLAIIFSVIYWRNTKVGNLTNTKRMSTLANIFSVLALLTAVVIPFSFIPLKPETPGYNAIIISSIMSSAIIILLDVVFSSISVKVTQKYNLVEEENEDKEKSEGK